MSKRRILNSSTYYRIFNEVSSWSGHNRGFFDNHKVREIFGRVRIESKPDLILERIQDFFSNSIINITSRLYGGAQNQNSIPTNRPYGGTRSLNSLKKTRVWKLDLLIKQLIESGVLVVSYYSYTKKKTREYGYGLYFNLLLDGKKTQLTKSEVHPKYFNQIKKESKPVSLRLKPNMIY